MSYQQVMMVSIKGKQLNLRGEIVGWTFECGNEDADLVQEDPDRAVGTFHSGRKMSCPSTVAHALRFGWKFLSYSLYSEVVGDIPLPMVEVIMTRDVDYNGNPI